MRPNYILIPLVAVFVALLGARFTMAGVRTWYAKIRKPGWTPKGDVIGIVWTILYILAAISALMVWNVGGAVAAARPAGFGFIAALFALNAAANVFWSYVFFSRRRMGPAIWICLVLDLTIVALIQLIAPVSVVAAWLLVPYAGWVTFAAYLNYRVWEMNRR